MQQGTFSSSLFIMHQPTKSSLITRRSFLLSLRHYLIVTSFPFSRHPFLPFIAAIMHKSRLIEGIFLFLYCLLFTKSWAYINQLILIQKAEVVLFTLCISFGTIQFLAKICVSVVLVDPAQQLAINVRSWMGRRQLTRSVFLANICMAAHKELRPTTNENNTANHFVSWKSTRQK